MPVAYLMLLLLDKTGFHREAVKARAALYETILNDDGQILEAFNSHAAAGLDGRDLPPIESEIIQSSRNDT